MKKCRIPVLITTIVHTVWFLLIALNFITIRLFTEGVPCTYPFAILGCVLLTLCPVELCCLIVNLIFIHMDMKCSGNRTKLILMFIAAIVVFIFFCLLKFWLYRYGDVLVGVV